MNPDTNSQNVPSGSSTTFSLKNIFFCFFFKQATRSLQHEEPTQPATPAGAASDAAHHPSGEGEQLPPPPPPQPSSPHCRALASSPDLPPRSHPSHGLSYSATPLQRQWDTVGLCSLHFVALCNCVVREKKTAARFLKRKSFTKNLQ